MLHEALSIPRGCPASAPESKNDDVQQIPEPAIFMVITAMMLWFSGHRSNFSREASLRKRLNTKQSPIITIEPIKH